MNTTIRLTAEGVRKVTLYKKELLAKRKKILDAKLDTADDTTIPTIADVESDIAWEVNIYKEGLEYKEYLNSWGVTDHHEADYPLCLEAEKDFLFFPKLTDFFTYEMSEEDGYITVNGKSYEYTMNLSQEYADDESLRVLIDGRFYYFG